jgi:hypothetical protein
MQNVIDPIKMNEFINTPDLIETAKKVSDVGTDASPMPFDQTPIDGTPRPLVKLDTGHSTINRSALVPSIQPTEQI